MGTNKASRKMKKQVGQEAHELFIRSVQRLQQRIDGGAAILTPACRRRHDGSVASQHRAFADAFLAILISCAVPARPCLTTPLGGGKTTLVESLVGLFADQGLTCVAMSLDDFYLTHADQLAVKESNSGNRLLELRGNPGTHDMPLALRTLESLRDGEVHDEHAIPRYDKSCFGGKGDRFPADQWPRLIGTPDVVLFEGWCFGFSAVDESELADQDLVPINALLEEGGDYAKLHAMMGAWIIVQIESPKVVYRWREQAEVALRESGRGGMSQRELADFVSRYMPAYAHYLPGLYADCAGYSPLYIQIDDNRNPLQVN